MKKFTLLSLCLASTMAVAECHIRSSVHLTRAQIEVGPVDIQKLVTPDVKGHHCVMQYRVYANNQWKTLEGVGTGVSEEAACSQALDVGNGSLLIDVDPSSLKADTQMVCSDLEEIKIHPVNVGDVIWESETDLHQHPAERKPFTYKRDTCRFFSERAVKEQNMWVYQGIICKLNYTPNSKWLVVDKF